MATPQELLIERSIHIYIPLVHRNLPTVYAKAFNSTMRNFSEHFVIHFGKKWEA